MRVLPTIHEALSEIGVTDPDNYRVINLGDGTADLLFTARARETIDQLRRLPGWKLRGIVRPGSSALVFVRRTRSVGRRVARLMPAG
ncbi:MAG TPA: hypothetical protein ENK18_23050 [Deltaproteobacteria bacterium]|nr:hypothetical protein [Deltaproteobacteria bacterium]